MKRLIFGLAFLSAAFLISSNDLDGRGGRGGGGGGGGGRGGAVGGGFSGGGSISRGGGLGSAGPSVSRPIAPSVGGGPVGGKVGGGGGRVPGVGSGPIGSKPGIGGPGKGPSAGQLQNFLDMSGPQGGPRAGTLPAGGPGAVADFFQKGPGPVRPATLPAGGTKIAGKGLPGTGLPGKGIPGAGLGKAGQLPAGRPSRIENRDQRTQQRQDRRNEIQNEFRDNHPRFDWAMDHPRWAAWRVNRPYRWATAAALTAWCGYGSSLYYNYGDNIYYQDDAVYSGGEAICSTEEYAASAETIVTSIPETKNPDWMPLGVFAVTQDGKASGPAPTLFVQLNVSKEGLIAGSLQNSADGTSQPLEGMVDKASQRAAWVVCGKSRPIMETGIFNLAKDTAPALVHFADGQTQQWLLVRMDEPKESAPKE